MQDLNLEKQLSPSVWLARKKDGSLVILRTLPVHYKDILEKLQPPIPGIPRILQMEVQGEFLYVTEEYIPYASLDRQTLSSSQLLPIMNRLCDIVQQVHERGIIHRDIKPEHILTDGERVWLVDFGASRLVQPNKDRDTTLLGTAGYASPEQYGFAQTDVRSDIWSMGKVLEELDTAGKFGRITRRATQMDPADRYRSCREFQKDLNGRLFIFPGINNRTLSGKLVSLAWMLAAAVFVWYMPAEPETGTWMEMAAIRLGSFYILCSPLFIVCDQQLFARLPFGQFLPIRLVYATAVSLAGFFLLLVLCAIALVVC